MRTCAQTILALGILAGATALAAASPVAGPLASSPTLGDNPAIHLAQGNCGGAAQAAAQQHGGQVVGAPRPDGRGGCVVTLLVPGPPGTPPQRIQVTVPAR